MSAIAMWKRRGKKIRLGFDLRSTAGPEDTNERKTDMNAKVKKTEKSPFNKLVLNNISQAGKTMIAEYVQRVMSETSDEQWAELRGGASMSGAPVFADLQSEIDKMKLTSKGCSWLKDTTAAQVREILHRVSKLTYKVGGKVVRIGRRIVNWIFSVLDRFPRSVGAIVLVVLIGALLGAIPLIGGLVSCLFQIPALYAAGALVFLEAGADLWIEVKRA